jgi:hypothetical protein
MVKAEAELDLTRHTLGFEKLCDGHLFAKNDPIKQ